MIGIAVTGASGRMGQNVIQAVKDSEGVELVGAIVPPTSPWVGRDPGELIGVSPLGVTITDDLRVALPKAQAVIDFTTPQVTLQFASWCCEQGVPLVVGTTGLESEHKGRLQAIGEDLPLVVAPNMSVGVNLCFDLLAKIARILGEGYDVEIIESHHRNKVDAPSGTALRMGEVVAESLGQTLAGSAVYGRQGYTGARSDSAIGFGSIRAGDIVGEHTVLFAGPGERLELSHKASSRMVFAYGAVRAARWLVEQSPGVYDMQDVLGLR